MLEIKNYKCDKNTPSDDEIKQAIQIAKESNCIVRLNWFFPYSGNYKLDITAENTFEGCKNKLPKCYGV